MTQIKNGPEDVATHRFAQTSEPQARIGAIGEGKARIGAIIDLPQLLMELGLDPNHVCSRSGVDPRIFDDPENRITDLALGKLLANCALLSQRADFGLMLGARFTLCNLGVLGDLMRHSATLSEALRSLILYLHFYDRLAFPILLRIQPSVVFLGYSIQHPTLPGTPQLYDTSITIAYRMIRELMGQAWHVNYAQFSHTQPDNCTTYRRVFGPKVLFDAESSGICFDASWLNKEVPGANPERFQQLDALIQDAHASENMSFSEQVRGVIHQLLIGGTTSAVSVAHLFDISERTLRHKLGEEGTSMHALLAETRFEYACELLQHTRLPISKIADGVCYADTAAFSRAFRGWAGVSPRQWRDSHGRETET